MVLTVGLWRGNTRLGFKLISSILCNSIPSYVAWRSFNLTSRPKQFLRESVYIQRSKRLQIYIHQAKATIFKRSLSVCWRAGATARLAVIYLLKGMSQLVELQEWQIAWLQYVYTSGYLRKSYVTSVLMTCTGDGRWIRASRLCLVDRQDIDFRRDRVQAKRIEFGTVSRLVCNSVTSDRMNQLNNREFRYILGTRN